MYKKEFVVPLFIDIFDHKVGRLIFHEQNEETNNIVAYLIGLGFIKIGDTKSCIEKNNYEVFFTHSVKYDRKRYEYKAGDYVYYIFKKELGKVKRIRESGSIFVWYHTGDTAACTPNEFMKVLIPNTIAQELEESEIYTILDYMSHKKYEFSTDFYTIHEIIKKAT